MGSSREKRGPIRSTRWRQVLRRTVTRRPLGPLLGGLRVRHHLFSAGGHTWTCVTLCALSRFVADRGNHSGLASRSTMWCLSPALFLSPPASSSADLFLRLLNPPVSIVCSFPPHSFIPMFVLLFALPRLNYVCVYLCRLTLVPTTIPDSPAVTRI